MTHSIRKSLWVLLLAGLAGCTGNAGAGNSGGSGSTGVTGISGATGSAGTIGTGGGGGGLVISTCAPGIPVSSQIPRLTRLQYATVINELLGVTPGADVMDLIANDSTGSLTDVSWNGYLTAADKIAAQVLGNATSKAKFITCDAAAATCLTDTIKAFGRKAYRRPLTDAEVTSFMRFNNLPQTHTPADVTEAILAAFLASPTFIMVPEVAEIPEGQAFKLNHFEVATKLSLLLWNSIPDADLNAAADGNQLGTPDQIAAQAKRMLADPKAAGVATTFHHIYADVQTGSHWINVSEHDTTKFPSFKPGSYNAAMQELDAFFVDMVKGGGTFKDLFLSTTAFVTKDTAGIYGLNAASYGDDAHEGGPRRDQAARVPHPRRLPQHVLSLRRDQPDPSRRVHHRARPQRPDRYTESAVPEHQATRWQLHDEPPSHRGAHGPGGLRRVPCRKGQSAGLRARAVRRSWWLAGHGSAGRRHQLDSRHHL